MTDLRDKAARDAALTRPCGAVECKICPVHAQDWLDLRRALDAQDAERERERNEAAAHLAMVHEAVAKYGNMAPETVETLFGELPDRARELLALAKDGEKWREFVARDNTHKVRPGGWTLEEAFTLMDAARAERDALRKQLDSPGLKESMDDILHPTRRLDAARQEREVAGGGRRGDDHGDDQVHSDAGAVLQPDGEPVSDASVHESLRDQREREAGGETGEINWRAEYDRHLVTCDGLKRQLKEAQQKAALYDEHMTATDCLRSRWELERDRDSFRARLAAMGPYTKHKPECGWHRGFNGLADCTCGLAALLREQDREARG